MKGTSINLSTKLSDQNWDNFVSKIPGGEFEQTSMWASAKYTCGWSPIRCYLTEKDDIKARFQILKKKYKGLVNIGYISRGPLFLDEKYTLLMPIVLKSMLQLARRFHISALIVHPPVEHKDFFSVAEKYGFTEMSLFHVIRYSLRIDLSQDLEAIFSNFKSKTRNEIRQGYRKNTKVINGNKDDLKIFFRFMLLTCERQGVKPNPSNIEFFNVLWDELSHYGDGSMKIFIAENHNKPLAACCNIAFGDTVRGWKLGWTGKGSRYRPNQLLVWESIQWAKKRGFKYFDFFGISEQAARVLNLQSSANNLDGPSAFKLKFGGFTVHYPPVFLFIKNPVLRLIATILLKMRED